jgi:arylsulfatase A-like enzyme
LVLPCSHKSNQQVNWPNKRANGKPFYDPIQKDFKENTPSGDSLTSWKYQRYMQDYLACILSVDENIGRLMKYLEETGLAKTPW